MKKFSLYSGVATLFICTVDVSLAADLQEYRVEIRPTGNSDIDQTLSDTSNLVSLNKTKAVEPFALSGRIKSDYDRLQAAMDSFGYYNAKIHINIGYEKSKNVDTQNSKKAKKKNDIKASVKTVTDLDNTIEATNADLPNYIEHIPEHHKAVIVIKIDKGEQFHIGKIEFKNGQNKSTVQQVRLTPDQEKAVKVETGQPAISADIVNIRGRLLTSLQEDGHALAKVSEPVAYLRPDTKTVDVVYNVEPGPIVNIGDIRFKGLNRVHEAFLRRRLLLHQGQLYQPSKIESARQDLSSLGVFSSIDMTADQKVDADGQLPLTVTFQEAKRRTISFEAGYSTDLGGRAGVRWAHHNLFGNAEELKLVALITGVGGSAQRSVGYDVYADFSKPDIWRRDQSFNARVEGVKQNLYSYDQTALLVKAGLNRKINKQWSVSGYVGGIQENIKQYVDRHHKDNNDYTMFNIPLSATYDGTDLAGPLMSPTHGMKASFGVTPTVAFGDGTTFFAILNGTGSTYFDLTHLGLTDPGRSVFAFRGTVGSIQGASRMSLPPDQRMYAGGTATVRGFRFQGVGPQIRGTKYAVGGKAMDAGSVEFRQRILSDFGAQAFVDAGQVSKNEAPFQGKLRVGTGVGAKYYTPLGPIRFDIAVPMNRPPRGDKFEVYISLGETF